MEYPEKKFGKGENRKTEFFSSFALSNLEAMRLLRKFGLLRQPGEQKDKPAWGKIEGKERSFRNIAEHSLVVGATADILFEKLAEKGYLTLQERKVGTKTAILHDLTKRQELEFKKGINEGEGAEVIDPEEKKKLAESFLAEHGISKEDRDTFNPYSVIPEIFGLNEAEVKPFASAQEIIRWTISVSDWMVAHTALVSPNERMEEAINRGDYNKDYLWWYKRIYKDDADADSKEPSSITKAVFEKAIPILNKVEGELKKALDIPGQEKLVDFVKGEFDKKFGDSIE